MLILPEVKFMFLLGLYANTPTPHSTGHMSPTFTNGWAREEHGLKTGKKVTDQTILTITKSVTKTTNCTCRAKKVEGHENIFLALRAGECPPPHFQLRSGATDGM